MSFLKKLVLFILIVSIIIPLWYGSTNHEYIFIRLLHSTLSFKYSILLDDVRPTLSAEYRAFENMLRMKPIEKYDSLVDPLTLVKKMRSTLRFDTIIPKSSQCQIKKEIFEYNEHIVDAYWINYHEKISDHILVYFHGGGYIAGDIHGYSSLECHFSHLFNISILHVEYRLCPEHPLPAAVEDSIAIYCALLRQNISSSQLLFMGDSAGGGLALLTIQGLITHQIPLPSGIIALSPCTDLSASGESYTRNRFTDIMISSEDDDWMIPQILGPNYLKLSPDNPIYSPLFGSFKEFPPMYITVGTAEVLEDDSRRVVKKAQDAGVDVTFEEGLHLMHIYPVFFPYYPEARNTLNNINKWIQKITAVKHSE